MRIASRVGQQGNREGRTGDRRTPCFVQNRTRRTERERERERERDYIVDAATAAVATGG